jgi:predicted DNA-binding protein
MNDLTPAQQLAMLANSPDGELPAPPTLKTMSIRLPFDLLAQIDALSSVTGVQSRNTLMISLLRAGVHAVVEELDDLEQYQAALEHFQDQYFNNQE